MPLSTFELLAADEYEQALRRIARRDALAEYNRGIIRDSREAIRRSRELLEATKHQVCPPSEGA